MYIYCVHTHHRTNDRITIAVGDFSFSSNKKPIVQNGPTNTFFFRTRADMFKTCFVSNSAQCEYVKTPVVCQNTDTCRESRIVRSLLIRQFFFFLISRRHHLHERCRVFYVAVPFDTTKTSLNKITNNCFIQIDLVFLVMRRCPLTPVVGGGGRCKVTCFSETQ